MVIKSAWLKDLLQTQIASGNLHRRAKHILSLILAISSSVVTSKPSTAACSAVVLTTRCKVLGFGGEIVIAPSALKEVKVAQNPSASEWEMKPIESNGTRHRSAFRLCNELEDCVVFVVSQDGPIKAVKRDGADVLLWNDALLRDYDL